jgi:outer membrane protein assembly factor BamB
MTRWLLLIASVAAAGEWTAFQRVAEVRGLPVELGRGKNVVWRTPLARGESSPVLAGGRAFLTAFEGDSLLTLGVDTATGKVVWKQALARPRSETLHKLNSPASATPALDSAGNVYVFFGDFGLASYTRDGRERWRLPLGPFANLHGMAASPVVVGTRVILACDQDTESFLLAVDKETGKVAWRTKRDAVVHGFATPTVFQPEGGEAQIVLPGSYMLASYSAETGKELWTVRGLSWQIKTTAAVRDGIIYATGWAPGADPGESKPLPPYDEVLAEIDGNNDGKLAPEEINPTRFKHGGSWRAIDLNNDGFLDSRDWLFYRARRSARNVTLAIKPGNARGDLTDTHVLWRNERFVPQVSSPLVYGEWVWIVKDGGILTNIDLKTGKTVKTARIPNAMDPYYSSPVAGDGKVYVGSEGGKLSVIKPGAEWEVLTVNDLEEPIYATPALESGRVYVRTAAALYCFGASDSK